MASHGVIGKDGSAPVMQATIIIPQFQITLIPSLGDWVPRKKSMRQLGISWEEETIKGIDFLN